MQNTEAFHQTWWKNSLFSAILVVTSKHGSFSYICWSSFRAIYNRHWMQKLSSGMVYSSLCMNIQYPLKLGGIATKLLYPLRSGLISLIQQIGGLVNWKRLHYTHTMPNYYLHKNSNCVICFNACSYNCTSIVPRIPTLAPSHLE